jgi:hypothetical protein
VAEKVKNPERIPHGEFRDVYNAWNFYNVVNEEAKALSVNRQPEALRKCLEVVAGAVDVQLN